MNDQKTYEEHIDDVRESDENEIEARMNHLDKVANEQDRTPIYSYSLITKLIIASVAMFLSGFFGGIFFPTQPIFGAIVVASGVSILLFITISKVGIAGREEFSQLMKKSVNDHNQQEQKQDKANQKKIQQKICQNCGWKNPKSNKFCHDCGNEL
jgi:ribosomal protein L40E